MFNKKGFTLVEIMIAAAALGGLALVGMEILKNQAKTSAKGNFDSDVLLTTNEINAILSDPTKCFNTLAGKNAIATTTGIDAINANKYYSIASGSAPADGYGNSNLQIQDYALSATATEVAGNNSFLLIKYQNKNILKGESGAATIQKKINLYVEVDGSNNIIRCRSLSTSSTDIWSRATGSDIYYNGGKVGIGIAAPTSELDVTGDIKSSGVVWATSFQYTSDRNLKKNIAPILNPLEKILALRGVYFDWKDNNKHDIGFIAQEVKMQIPEVVRRDPHQDILTVDYAKIVPILVEALKQQQEEIKELKNKIHEIQKHE